MRRAQPDPPGASSQPGRGAILGICAFLAVASWAIFGQTLSHDFVNYDDDQYVYENPVVSAALTLDGVTWAFTRVHYFNWHPLTWISHMLDCELHGLDPRGHHLTSVVLHGAAAILLFLALYRLTAGVWCSAFVATLFATHPLHVESVAWVTERKDVLSGVFFGLTLMAYARYARLPPSLPRYLGVAVCFALGLLSGRRSCETAPVPSGSPRAPTCSRGGALAIRATLAAAYAEAGRFADATRTAEEAIEAARAEGQEAFARQVQQHLELYRAGRALQPEPSGP